MKKFLSAFLITALLVTANGATPAAAAGTNVNVVFEGEIQQYDQPATVINGRTMVPLRAIFEKLGADVQWDANTQTITAKRNRLTLTLKVGSTTASKKYVSGQTKEYTLDQAPVILGGRTLVPLRFVSEAFYAGVAWDGATGTATIKKYKDLTIAASENDLAYIKTQIEAGADINVKDSRNASVLAQAVGFGNLELVNYLISKGADINTVDVDGDSPLMYAAMMGDLEKTKALLATGNANMTYRNKINLTALGLAKRYKRTDVVNLLVGSGAPE